jgi:ribosomal protein S12 methylthiotransferase
LTPERPNGMGGTFYIESLGCAKNQVDSEAMIAAMEDAGFSFVETPDEADVIVVNTCGFLEAAKRESIDTCLGLRSRFPKKRLIMAGCLSQRYAADLAAEMPEIDAFAGNRDPREVVRLAAGASASKRRGVRSAACLPARNRLLSPPGSAYLKVAEGCDNRCTYCAIPLIRGPLASRERGEVVREARALLGRGIREIVLIAQDLGSYGLDRGGEELTGLISELDGLPGRFWIRLLYVHPDRFPMGLLPVIRGSARVLPYFDIPFQHASPGILRAMGRRGDARTYLDLIRLIREALPDAVIRTTFLTGFPGETEEDFRLLLDFQARAEPDWCGAFAYSREEGTPAFGLPGRVAKSAAARRKAAVEEAQVPITARRLERFLGRTLDVLLEEEVEGEGLWIGRAYLQAPEVDGLTVVAGEGLAPGSVVPVRITRRNGVDLEGLAGGRSNG